MNGGIRTNAAAAMLGISPNTLRSWERRFGFPEPRRSAGGHRQFDLAEIEALRAGLEETQNISSAISLARERGTGPSSPVRLRSAYARFDEAGADRLLEESLTLRSVERTLEEVLLPAVAGMAEDPDPARAPRAGLSPEADLAWRHATGWMAAALRLAPPASRPEGVLVFDAARPLAADALHAQALELVLRRAGLRTLTLTAACDPSRLNRAVTALNPQAVVLAGRGASLDVLGRLVFAARRACGESVAILDFRGAIPHTGDSTVAELPDNLMGARTAILEGLGTQGPVGRFASRPLTRVLAAERLA
jgi:DNA-binding transcriptional MerR regulator